MSLTSNSTIPISVDANNEESVLTIKPYSGSSIPTDNRYIGKLVIKFTPNTLNDLDKKVLFSFD